MKKVKIKLSNYHPIGSFFITESDDSPADLFGGTWEKLKDRFLLGAGDIYSCGSAGGEATHTLSINEMPSHTHQFTKYAIGWGAGSKDNSRGRVDTTSPAEPWYDELDYEGGSQPHNNMPPYFVVNIWKRVP